MFNSPTDAAPLISLETRNLNTDTRFQWENVYWGYVNQFAEQNDLRLSESLTKWTLESIVNIDKI